MITDNFTKRHIGPNAEEVEIMLKKIGVSSIDELIDETIPDNIRLKEPLNLSKGLSEFEYFNHIKELASKNKVFNSFIGLGYYNTIVPGVVIRNVLENPGWYTSYTPYQAEISQGRLEALLKFQTVISDLTGMEIAKSFMASFAPDRYKSMMTAAEGVDKQKPSPATDIDDYVADADDDYEDVFLARFQLDF